MTGDQLKSILISEQKGAASYPERSALFSFCKGVVKSFLKAHLPSVSQLCQGHGITLDQLAIDVFGEFFRQDSSSRYTAILNFLAALPSDLKTIDSWALLLKFQQSVLASTQSSIALAYHESDPIGSKILRNVREGVRKNDSLRIANHYKKNYVEIKNRKIREHLPEFPLEILERELPRHVSQNSTMPDILDGLACIFRKRRRFLPAVALNDLVRIVRKFYIPENDGEPISHDGSLISEEIETIQRKVHRTLVEKIWVGYVLKEKMSKKEASLVSQALFEIMTSWWSSDGKDGSVAKIAQKHLNVTAEEYTHDWRTYVEYFVKLAKEEFRNYLDDDIL